MEPLQTADLCDKFGDALGYVDLQFKSYGPRKSFSGQIVTLKVFEDNSFVKKLLSTNGKGKVLVVDGGASMRRALIGDLIAADLAKNQWEGAIVNGCIRDSAKIAEIPNVGIKALGTHPRKTEKKNVGEEGLVLEFGGVKWVPGGWVAADEDGVVVAEFDLRNEKSKL